MRRTAASVEIGPRLECLCRTTDALQTPDVRSDPLGPLARLRAEVAEQPPAASVVVAATLPAGVMGVAGLAGVPRAPRHAVRVLDRRRPVVHATAVTRPADPNGAMVSRVAGRARPAAATSRGAMTTTADAVGRRDGTLHAATHEPCRPRTQIVPAGTILRAPTPGSDRGVARRVALNMAHGQAAGAIECRHDVSSHSELLHRSVRWRSRLRAVLANLDKR